MLYHAAGIIILSITQVHLANNAGLDAGVAGSKLSFTSTVAQQGIVFGNQTFGGVITTPDLDISNTVTGYSGGAYTASTGYVRDLIVEPSGNFYVYNGNTSAVSFNVARNITNNGTIYVDVVGTPNYASCAIITLNGTGLQTISGSGVWAMTANNTNSPIAGVGRFPGLTINNTSGLNPAVLITAPQSIALQNTLNLTNGILGGTGTLTLGDGVSGQTLNTNVLNGRIPLSGTSPLLTMGYNLSTMTFNLNYNNTASYTTGGELPALTASVPSGGTMVIGGAGATSQAVTLGSDGIAYMVTIANNPNSILRLNGHTLSMNGMNQVSCCWNYAAFNNTGTLANNAGLDASVAGSKLSFTGNGIQQGIIFGNQVFGGVTTTPDLDISNNYAGSSGGAYTESTGYIRNLIVEPSGNFFVWDNPANNLGSIVLYVSGNITNNGIIYTDGSCTGELLVMNGTTQQTIYGPLDASPNTATGVWAMTGSGNTGTGQFPGFGINNSAGVTLNQSFAVQNTLFLGNGILGGSGTLTLGTGVSSTLNSYINNGSLGLKTAYNLQNVNYNINYNTTTTIGSITANTSGTITTGKELPPYSYSSYTSGTVSIVNTAGSGVKLGTGSNICSLNINGSSTLDMHGDTLGIFGSYTNNGTLKANAPTATLVFNGTSGQSMSNGTITGGYFSNITVNNAAGFTFNNSTQIGSLSPVINGALTLTSGNTAIANGQSLIIDGTISGAGTLSSNSNNTNLTLGGSVNGSIGTINLAGGTQYFQTFIVNLTGTNPSVNINGNLYLQQPFSLTSGLVNMGANIVAYTNTNSTPMLATNQNPNSCFTFIGGSSGFSWTMNSVGAGTYRWPIGPSGVVSGFRPVTIQTLQQASNPANVSIGFINLDGSGSYSATNIPNSNGDM